MIENPSINEKLNWQKAEVITAGVDIGAASSKALILLDGQPFAFSQVKTLTPKESAFNAVNAALVQTDLKLEKIHTIVATGCGRTQVQFAHKTVSEIVCAAAGAVHIWGPSVRTVLDIGGQSCKAIHCTEKGRATDFLWSDKCAAGIGRSMESFADLAKKDVTEIGEIALQSDEFPPLPAYLRFIYEGISKAVESFINTLLNFVKWTESKCTLRFDFISCFKTFFTKCTECLLNLSYIACLLIFTLYLKNKLSV